MMWFHRRLLAPPPFVATPVGGVSRPGFTLIEMSVVLVLVGLLVGGVLKGQQLIESTRLKMTVNQWQAARAAVTAFRDRFNALPGDFTAASRFIGAGTLVDGNGDGVIGTADQSFSSGVSGESSRAWEHLAHAGYLSGIQLDNGSAEDQSSMPAQLGGAYLVVLHGSFGNLGSGHWLRIQDTPSGAPTRNVLSGLQALEIDMRYDDGNADTGFIVMQDLAGGGVGIADRCKLADGVYASGDANVCTAVFFLQ